MEDTEVTNAQPHGGDERRDGDDRPGSADMTDQLVDGAQPKKNWGKWKCPMKRAAETTKGESKKRKHHSKTQDSDTVADDARGSPRASTSGDSEEEDDSDGESGKSSGDSSSSSEESDGEEVAAKPPPTASKKKKSTSARFDPGVGDSVVFSLPTEDMVQYCTKMFTS